MPPTQNYSQDQESSTNHIRIAKFIARAGYCSRREAEYLILEGRVKLNNKTVTEYATFVSEWDNIEVNGFKINLASKREKLWAYYKPIGVITTHFDPQGRVTVISSVLRQIKERHVITIGRLDINSEGLLLLTNSGDIANEFMLPKNNYIRKYKVRALGNFDQNEILDASQNGIAIDGMYYKPFQLKLTKSGVNNWFEISIYEGKNREIRKIFEYFGMQVSRLIRVQYGKYTLGNLQPNEIRQIDI